MLKDSLANALYDPAMDLALEQERVDGAAEIVGDGVALDYDGAGIEEKWKQYLEAWSLLER